MKSTVCDENPSFPRGFGSDFTALTRLWISATPKSSPSPAKRRSKPRLADV